MRGAALYFVRQIRNLSDYDLILASDMMNLTDFMALAGKKIPPVVLYFHENQLSYPLSPRQKSDRHLELTNIISAVAARRVLFNSRFHLTAFLRAAKHLVRQMPDTRPGWVLDAIQKKAQVVYPGCWFDKTEPMVFSEKISPPLVVWNHRWDFDKKPEIFFDALTRIQKKEIDFSLALLGEAPGKYPSIFDTAKEQFKTELVAFGFEPLHSRYLSWLQKGTVVVSCAIQENFGISVVEAIRKGCFPLLPDRLSYPEIIPDHLHGHTLYKSKKSFAEKLEHALLNPSVLLPMQQELSTAMGCYAWENMIQTYDDILESNG